MTGYLSLTEASAVLGGRPSRWSLLRWAREGRIEASKTLGGGVWCLSRDQLDRLMERMREAGDGTTQHD